jgi:four helix bundle protein
MAETPLPGNFVSKLSDSEGEAEETRVKLEFSWRCGYMSKSEASELDAEYDQIIGQLVRMIDRPDQWVIDTKRIRRA